MIDSIAINQILILLLQCFIVAVLLLFLFRLRTIFGMGLLFTALGVFQYMQVFLAASLYIEVIPGIMVTPGSMVMFTGSLFAVLLIYIREDALEARKVIYALLAANLVLALLQIVFSWAVEGDFVTNIYNLPKEFFTINSRFLFVGTIVLFIDAFVIIFIYEAIARNISSLFLRMLITMILVLAIDTTLFSLGTFAGTDQFKSIFVSGLVSKFSSAIVYSTLFSIYLVYLDKGLKKNEISTSSFQDIFHTLTYRQKFEQIYKESEIQKIELQQSEEKFRSFVEQASEGIYLAEMKSPIPINMSIEDQIKNIYKGHIIEANDSQAQMYGYTTADELVGVSLAELHGGTDNPVNIEFIKSWIEAEYRIAGAESEEFDKDGNKVWFSNNIIGFIENGYLMRLWGTQTDITAQKEANEELGKFANRLQILHKMDKYILAAESPEKIALSVLEDIADFISFKIATVTEYNEASDTLSIILIFPSEYDNYVDNKPIHVSEYGFLDLNQLKNGKVQIVEDLRKTGTKFKNAQLLIDNGLFSTVLIPLISEDSLLGTLSFVGESMDVFPPEKIEVATEIANQLAISFQQWKLREEIINYTEELEQKVNQRTEQLEHSNQELREFAQIVSHDLKAPLRAISQLSYWVWKDYSDKIDEEGQEKLKMMIGRVKRLDNLIEGILQYSRAGRQREKEIPINLQLLVEESINLLDPPSNIKIIIENQLPEYIGDPTRLGQLFQNLINNAIKFMDKPNGLIKIGCTLDADNWQFYISDNGPGIEEKYFNRIFQIFQRLISRDEQEGTGIGLSLAKRIVHIYGGEIWLTSTYGEGTTFYFTLRL